MHVHFVHGGSASNGSLGKNDRAGTGMEDALIATWRCVNFNLFVHVCKALY